jgi:hypothetical protein
MIVLIFLKETLSSNPARIILEKPFNNVPIDPIKVKK